MRFNQLIILSLLLYGCANPVSPTGGEKDIIAPIITKIDTISKRGMVSVYFDENIKFQNNIQLNPSKGYKKVKVQVENKSIHIQLEKYTKSIAFNDAISDLNENNVAKYPFILLSKDSLKISVKYQNNQSSKTKVYGYITIDSLNYLADNSRKEELRFEGLPEGSHTITVYSDDNKNNNYDEFESYSKVESKNIDSIFTYLYPPKKEIVYQIQKDTEQLSYIVTNSFKIRQAIENISETTAHLDTLAYLTKDSLKVLQIIKDHILKKQSFKKISQTKSIPYIYVDGKDTLYKTEYPLFHNGPVKHSALEYYSKRNLNGTLKKRDTTEKSYRKLGKVIFQNDSNIYYRLIIYKGKVELVNSELIKGNTEFILPVGSYTYLIWRDENNNMESNPGEDIINYYFGFDVNAQLSNTIIVKKSKNQEKNSTNSKTILSDQ